MAYTASYIYEIHDRYSHVLQRISSRTDRFVNSANRAKLAVKTFGARMQGFGTQLANVQTGLGALGAGMALRGIIGTAVRFQRALNEVEAVTGSTATQMGNLRQQAKMLGRETQFSAVQSADAMVFLGRAGLKAAQIIEVMPSMLDLAAAGSLELASAADIATNVLFAFRKPLSELGHVSDVLAYTAANANTNVYELAEGMKNAAATASLAGVSVEETSAALGVLANAGIKGGEGGTQLMNAFRALTAMAPKSQKALRKLGINPRKILDDQGKIKDFTGLIGQLADKGAKLGDLFKLFDIRGAKAVGVLKQAGETQLKDFTNRLIGATGASKKMADILMKGAPGAIMRFVSAWEGAKLVMADTILPIFTKMLLKLTDLLSNLQDSHPWLLKMTMGLLILFAGLSAVLVPLGIIAMSLGALTPVISLLSGTVGIFAAAAAYVAYVFWKWDKSGHPVVQTVKDLFSSLKDLLLIFTPLNDAMMTGNESVGIIDKGMSALGNTLGFVFKIIEAVIRAVTGLTASLFSVVPAVAKLLVGDFRGAWDELKKGGQYAFEGLKKSVPPLSDALQHGLAVFSEGIYDIGAEKGIRAYTEARKIAKDITGMYGLFAEKADTGLRADVLRMQDKFALFDVKSALGEYPKGLFRREEQTLNGKIVVSAEKGAAVKSAEIMAGDTGQNFATGY